MGAAAPWQMNWEVELPVKRGKAWGRGGEFGVGKIGHRTIYVKSVEATALQTS